jgi:hypothetical protein
MPEKKTLERARQDKRQGKSPSTQAGEFVRETMDHIRQGKHGARSTKQAIAIGLSKARRAGVDLPPPARGKTSERARQAAKRAYEKGQTEAHHHKVNPRRSKAITKALQHEGHQAASHAALARQARSQAHQRSAEERSEIGRKAAKTRLAHQNPQERSGTRKAARTRATRQHHAG